MKLWKFVLVTMLVTLPVVSAVAQDDVEQPYDVAVSPVDLLASYYNAINLQDYERAYAYWQDAPNSYDDFAAGFADTTDIQVIVQPPTSGEGAAGSTYVSIPTVLIADHTDKSVHTYAGCFVTRKSNLLPPDIPEADTWHLYSADVIEVTDNTPIPTLLKHACDPAQG